jgi:hypothetical protein
VKRVGPLPHFSSENDRNARLIGGDRRRLDTEINKLITCVNAPA